MSAPQDGPTESPSEGSGDVPFSIYTAGQKRTMVLAVSLFALLSPASASIYYPALNAISEDLGVSEAQTSLSVTTYMILQGVAPMFVGSFSDVSGRRLAYLGSFGVYMVANLGLALQDSYAALLVLRCMQSAGSSGMVAMANGVVADVVLPAERGTYMGWASVANLLGPALAPVLGGVLTQYLGWHAIFWFLLCLAAAMAVPFAIWFPETNRRLVGNGSRLPPAASRPWATWLTPGAGPPGQTEQDREKPRTRLQLPDPLEVVRIVLDPEGFVVVMGSGLVMVNMYAVLIGLPYLMKSVYQLQEVIASLCFLPFGTGSAVSTVITGRMLDYEYKKRARPSQREQSGGTISSTAEMSLERARLKPTWPLFVLGLGSLLSYGWAVDTRDHPRVHLAVPLVLLFVVGWTTTAAFQVLNVLLMDNFPRRAASASAANNLLRCSLGAGMTAAVIPLIDAVGPGWTYTVSAGVWAVMAPPLGCLVVYGPGWRSRREPREPEPPQQGGT